ncbi:MAG TPA: hypothetical protein VHH33_09920 [Nitrososphaeraceae archaeon]|nr:hypothetical protein [Nitrososphaeraceae archaeon]
MNDLGQEELKVLLLIPNIRIHFRTDIVMGTDEFIKLVLLHRDTMKWISGSCTKVMDRTNFDVTMNKNFPRNELMSSNSRPDEHRFITRQFSN